MTKPPCGGGKIAPFISLQKADMKTSSCACCGVLRAADGGIHLSEKILGVNVKALSRGCKPDGTLPAVEQLTSERFLERPDMLCHGGLRDEKLLCRLGEAPVFCGGGEDLQLRLIHADLLR